MLANGSSYAQIVRAVAAVGADAVSLDSVRNHASRHFPVQNAAQATYREIVERRAAENEVDFENGLKIALTPMAYLETLMVKGFDKLVKDDTEVSVEAGLRAAEKLQAVVMAHDYTAEVVGSWARAAHLSTDFRRFGGLRVSTVRRVYPRGPLGRPRPFPTLVAIDIHDVQPRTTA